MNTIPSKRLRWALAVLIGLPGTVAYLPVAVFMVYAGAASAADALRGGPWTYSPPPTLNDGLLNAGWGIAGILGLLGFWLWVFQPSWNSRPIGRCLVACLVVAGMAAMTPVAAVLLITPAQVSAWSLLTVLTVLGICAGLLVLYHQLLPLTRAASQEPPGN